MSVHVHMRTLFLLQDSALLLHSDHAAIQLAGASACGTLISKLVTQLAARRPPAGRQLPLTRVADAAHDCAVEGRSEALPPPCDQAPCACVSPPPLGGRMRRLLACTRLSFARCGVTAHVGPRDSLRVALDAASSACASSWQLARLQVAMNGADVLRCQDIGLTASVVSGSPAAGQQVSHSFPAMLINDTVMAPPESHHITTARVPAQHASAVQWPSCDMT